MDLNCKCPQCPGKLMFDVDHTVNTRGASYKIKVQHAKGPRARFFATRAISVWNSLPAKVVTVSTVNELKSALAKDPTEKSLMYTMYRN